MSYWDMVVWRPQLNLLDLCDGDRDRVNVIDFLNLMAMLAAMGKVFQKHGVDTSDIHNAHIFYSDASYYRIRLPDSAAMTTIPQDDTCLPEPFLLDTLVKIEPEAVGAAVGSWWDGAYYFSIGCIPKNKHWEKDIIVLSREVERSFLR